ncbi:MAG: thiol-disulfide isomerase [Desulfobacterales bacterium]|nr:thiol-disulfide isomerase [Desulfobacterales bacterium]
MNKANNKITKTSNAEFETAVAKQNSATYAFRLYITGMTPRSIQAIAKVRQLCEKHLAGRFELKVIDIYQQPALAKGEQIIATPTLIKELPLPLRKFIGDMSETEKFLVGVDLKSKDG